MELILSGIWWAAGIYIYGTMTRSEVAEREVFAMVMVIMFSVVNGVLL